MQGLSEGQLLLALFGLALILVAARAAGEIARRVGQPEVLGQLLAGFLLGPSVLGALAPTVNHALFQNAATAPFFSGLSWVGAILLLTLAGIEVDLHLLRAEARPGLLAACLAIAASLGLGVVFGLYVLARPFQNAIFLGIVLSVTAVSVVARIFLERDTIRRRYAQVVIAAGIASEVVVWPLVAVTSAFHTRFPLLAGAKAALFVALFFVFMFTLGRRFTFWAMRRVADFTQVVDGQLSLALVFTFVAAGVTQLLGVHPLLGAFVFGVLLGRAPRTHQANSSLMKSLQTLTTSLFAPVFFTLAGMRVNLFQLGGASVIGVILALFVVATVVKVAFGFLGARLGRLPTWEAAIVGVGVNLKGGTDVIIAIIGVELGLLSSQTYTIYAVVALLTVVISPAALAYLERRATPSAAEQERMEREEATSRAYAPQIERVLALNAPDMFAASVAAVLHRIAVVKQREEQFFDITELALTPADEVSLASVPSAPTQPDSRGVTAHGAAPTSARGADGAMSETLAEASTLENVEISQRSQTVMPTPQTGADGKPDVAAILTHAEAHQLIAIGATPTLRRRTFTFGPTQDAIIRQATCDVLVVSDPNGRLTVAEGSPITRVLAPVIDLEYSLAAADLAAYVASGFDAELVLLTVAAPDLNGVFWREQEQQRLRRLAESSVEEAEFRVRRLGVRVSSRILVNQRPAVAILRELKEGAYDALALGTYQRGARSHVQLGPVATSVLLKCPVPALTLVSHRTS